MTYSQPTVTVGITTCYGEASILDTVRSVRQSRGVDHFRFIIVADRVPITPNLKRGLEEYDVELIENKSEGSQFKKQKQIFALCTSDILVFTQDDVLFESSTLASIVRQFANDSRTTFVSVRNQPVQPTSLFEAALSAGTNIANRIARSWNGGDNYLSVIGRCMAFRTSWIKGHMVLRDDVVSSDAFCYFENKRNGGVYRFLPDVAVLFKNPQNMKEHIRKSSRFQYSELELSAYFGNLHSEYAVPKRIALTAFFQEFLAHPLTTGLYVIIYVYTRCFTGDRTATLNANWEVDLSTKKVL